MIPALADRCWEQAIKNHERVHPNNLALKLFMQRVGMKMKLDSSPPSVTKLAAELHAFAVKYERLAADDLKKILY